MKNLQSRTQAVILAAGGSIRFGSDKRRALLNGVPLLTKTLELYLEVFESVSVVVRSKAEVSDLVPDSCSICIAEDADQGLSQSLKAGVEGLKGVDWVLIGLADMPFVKLETLNVLKAQSSSGRIVRPCYRGKPGNPVGFPSRFFRALMLERGDQGARRLLSKKIAQTTFLETADPGVLVDIDTPENLTSHQS